ncbi:hypothetical protein HGG75_17605 [Ochrobactrum pseudogrignonense]|nr:hypothetical protein [Brucella pseudogrignonensis]
MVGNFCRPDCNTRRSFGSQIAGDQCGGLHARCAKNPIRQFNNLDEAVKIFDAATLFRELLL